MTLHPIGESRLQGTLAPAGVRELLRRLLLFGGLLAALWSGLSYTPALISVRPEDFAEDMKSRPGYWGGAAGLTLEQFIEKQTKDRLIQVEGSAWQAFFDEVQTANVSRGTHPWKARFGRDYANSRLFFRPGEQPLDELVGKLTRNRDFSFLALNTGNESRYLSANYVRGSGLGVAPLVVSRPLRAWSWPLLLIGLLSYILIPWPKHPPESVHYQIGTAGILPDLIATIGGGLFFGVPILVLSGSGGPAMGGTPLDFSTGAGFFTLVFWAFSFGLVVPMSWVAISYSTFELQILPDRLIQSTYRGSAAILFPEIRSVQLVKSRPPRWLRLVSLLARKPSLAALASDRQPGIELQLKNGEVRKLWLRGISGEGRLLSALRAAGVSVTP